MTDEIDERRAKAWLGGEDAWNNTNERAHQIAMDAARAIRASDEAAGYILIKHEGIISSEGMKPKGGK
jgi:hypothetical protein